MQNDHEYYIWQNYHEIKVGKNYHEIMDGKTVMNIQIYHEIVYNVKNILCKYLFWQQASYEIFILTITHENKI